MSAEYNGWRNKETWLVNMWIDAEGYAGGADAVADEARDLAQNADGDRGCVISQLAEFLERAVHDDLLIGHEDNPRAPKGLALDLLQDSLSVVDWESIAESYAEEAFNE